MEVNYLDLVGEGYMGSMQWQLGREMGTIPAFASMYSYCSSMYSYRCLCVVYVFLDAATLTEVFPCFFLTCKANARV